MVAVRPENVRLSKEPSTASDVNVLNGRIDSVVFLGNTLDVQVDVDGVLVRAEVRPDEAVEVNDTVTVTFRVGASRVVPLRNVGASDRAIASRE